MICDDEMGEGGHHKIRKMEIWYENGLVSIPTKMGSSQIGMIWESVLGSKGGRLERRENLFTLE